jgi:TRAP-type C4-dicarboxylate transport system permease small subunit
MQQIVKFVDAVNKIVGYVLALLMGVMAILVILQVLNRSVLHLPIHWSEELSRYLMIYVVFLGSSIAMRHNKLISIEILPQVLPAMQRKFLLLLVMILSFAFCVLMFVYGIQMLERVQAQSSAIMQISMAIPYASIPIGALFLMLNTVAFIFDEWTPRRKEDE